MTYLSIGKIAEKANVSVETIRFYERKGLVEEPQRKQSGYRQYLEGDVKKLIFIQHAKSLGFSLNEIKDLMTLQADERTTSREIKEMAQTKLNDIEEKIKMLQGMQRSLKSLVDKCPGEGPTSECPILEALDT